MASDGCVTYASRDASTAVAKGEGTQMCFGYGEFGGNWLTCPRNKNRASLKVQGDGGGKPEGNRAKKTGIRGTCHY